MYTNDRNAYRQVFFVVWQKYQKKMPLDQEESRLLQIMLDHPETHRMLDNPDTHLEQEYEFEENPFLHMSLHMALREQIRMDKPAGIKNFFEQYKLKYPGPLEAEHLILPTLVMMLRKGQETGAMPGDEEYLTELQKLS